MIQFKSLAYSRGRHTLVEGATLNIPHHARVGLIGANGCGKSSLFNLILGDFKPEEGEIFRPKKLKINHIAQEVPSSEQSALEFVLDGYQLYRDIENQLQEAEQKGDYEAQIELYEQWEAIQGQTLVIEATKIIRGLGFTQEEVSKPVNSFSGGWRVRLQLARTLLSPSDILLMDEPTNHLDLEAIFWLEKWCKNYQGTLVIIAHDIAFLDNVVDHIIHIENKHLHFYKGNYSFFVKTRAEKIALNEKHRQKQQVERAHLESFVNRFKAKASKAKQAQSRMKRLEKMEDIAAFHVTSSVRFQFEPVEAPTPLIRVTKGAVGYNNKAILEGISLYLGPGDRVALLGLNGQGKSTLVKLLADELKLLSGECYQAGKLKVGYFAQHQVEALSLDKTPFEILRKVRSTWTELEVRNFLGGFQFTNDKVFNKVCELSGGERARLALSLLVLDKPQIILLDEPTNHLDIEMREALALALQDFNGALVVVSHDRAFIEACCDELILIHDGTVTDYKGSLEDYAQWVSKLSAMQKGSSESKPKPKKKNDRSLANAIKKLEREISDLEKKLKKADKVLADDSLYENPNKLNECLALRDNIKLKLSEKETDWEQAQLQLEKDQG